MCYSNYAHKACILSPRRAPSHSLIFYNYYLNNYRDSLRNAEQLFVQFDEFCPVLNINRLKLTLIIMDNQISQ